MIFDDVCYKDEFLGTTGCVFSDGALIKPARYQEAIQGLHYFRDLPSISGRVGVEIYEFGDFYGGTDPNDVLKCVYGNLCFAIEDAFRYGYFRTAYDETAATISISMFLGQYYMSLSSLDGIRWDNDSAGTSGWFNGSIYGGSGNDQEASFSVYNNAISDITPVPLVASFPLLAAA